MQQILRHCHLSPLDDARVEDARGGERVVQQLAHRVALHVRAHADGEQLEARVVARARLVTVARDRVAAGSGGCKASLKTCELIGPEAVTLCVADVLAHEADAPKATVGEASACCRQVGLEVEGLHVRPAHKLGQAVLLRHDVITGKPTLSEPAASNEAVRAALFNCAGKVGEWAAGEEHRALVALSHEDSPRLFSI